MCEPDEKPLIYVVDDDPDFGASVARMLRRAGFAAEPFICPAQLLEAYAEAPASCIVTDVMMGELDGFNFADRLRAIDPATSLIFMTAWPTTANAVDSIRRHGGLDYLEKPIDDKRLLQAVREGVEWSAKRRSHLARTARLTPRERDVFALVVKGLSTKAIALELGLSPRTIDDYRTQIAVKTGAVNLAQLIALAD